MADRNKVRKLSHQLERIGWLLVFFAMLTQVSDRAFPSYNMVLGFWGAFCSFTHHARATFGLIIFTFFGVLLDIIYCFTNGSAESSSLFKFCLTMFVFCLLAKAYLCFIASKVFASIGGAQAMEASGMTSSAYDSLPGDDLEYSGNGGGNGGGGYYPPGSQSQTQMTSSIASFEAEEDRNVRNSLHAKPTPPNVPAMPNANAADPRRQQPLPHPGQGQQQQQYQQQYQQQQQLGHMQQPQHSAQPPWTQTASV